MQQGSHELVVVERAVELHREAVGNGGVAYVKAGFVDARENVVPDVVGLCFGGLVVDGVSVDEGDGEASGC